MKRFIALVVALVLIPAMVFATNLPVFKYATPTAGYTFAASQARTFGPIYMEQLDPKQIDGVVTLELKAISAAGAADVSVTVTALGKLITPVQETGVITCTDQPSTTQTVTLNQTVYTIDTDFDLGATLTVTLANLAAELNDGLEYSAVSDATTVTITRHQTGAFGDVFTETLTNCTMDGAGVFTGGVTGNTVMHSPAGTVIGAVTTSTNTDFAAPEVPNLIGVLVTPAQAYFVTITELSGSLSDTVVTGGLWFK